MKNLVAFIGVIGSGKDYRAAEYVKQGYVQVNFKDELLDMCSDLLGYDIRLEYDWFKNAIVGFRKPDNPLKEAMAISEMKEILSRNPQALTGRRLLTRLGTEVMRKRDENYWINAFISRVNHLKMFDIVISDCRFKNEMEALLNWPERESKFIFCNYHSPIYNANLDHLSEKFAQDLLEAGYQDGDIITGTGCWL